MTKKRWIVLAGLLAVCVALTLAALALLAAGTGVTPANIERIENGMTRAEVEEILGGPGVGFSPRGPTIWHHHDESYVAVYSGRDNPVFGNRSYDGAQVAVHFDRDNRVISRTQPENFRQKLYRLLRL
jgi:outer membrane protein assembly factor BamE (lipoprotein component of BamABCDE complex)